MKANMTRFAAVLGGISIVTAFGIAGVYEITHERTVEKERETLKAAYSEVFADATSFETLDGETWDGTGVGKAVGAGGILGYLAIGEKQGYSSRVRVLAACNTDYSVKAIRVLYAAETPGLGERAKEVKSDRTLWQALGETLGFSEGKAEKGKAEPWFQAQFAGKTLGQLVVVKGSGDGIQAITAATITSRAVTDAVRDALDSIMKATAAPAAQEK